MTSDFLVLECPRCGGRLRSSEEPNVFRCRHCDFDVMHRETRVVTRITVSPPKNESDDIEVFRIRLKALKAQLQKLRSKQGTGCGFFAVPFLFALIWAFLMGFSFGSVLLLIALVGAAVLVNAIQHSMNSPEERALEEQIRALEKVIARKEGW